MAKGPYQSVKYEDERCTWCSDNTRPCMVRCTLCTDERDGHKKGKPDECTNVKCADTSCRYYPGRR